jgi:ribosomal protein L11 methylase PrmA
MHAKAQERYADKAPQQDKGMSKDTLVGLIDNLKNTIQKLDWEAAGTEWGDYYEITNYTEAAFQHKQRLISDWVKEIKPAQVWDLGANTGVFSRLAAKQGAFTVSFDIDPAAVEQNYQQMRADKEENLLPLLLDLTNPSPAIGWHHHERHSLSGRGPVEMVFALALVHHLAISNNVPLPQLAAFFADLGKYLVIEFVPKSDSQVQKLLQSRQDIFDDYTQEEFERAFEEHFRIEKREHIQESERVLYLMGKR